MVDELQNFLGNIIEKKKERLVTREDFEDKDVLARILRRAKGEKLDDTFLLHTTSNPNVEKEIVREIRDKDGRLSDMVYMHASIYESLKLFPPFPADSKEAVEDDVWPDGTKVKKRTTIFYHIFAMGRSLELWGSDWAEFRPERWLERRSVSCRAKDPFTYPVFHREGPFHISSVSCRAKDLFRKRNRSCDRENGGFHHPKALLSRDGSRISKLRGPVKNSLST
ncbi:cytochrome 94A1-like [Capsicum annuum]|uniref:cytochrome P450 94A1-like n=1 Tax=Capsicum annuum TaxID=4072 RepID=UPI001FB06F43|nr:cytochrome P450 94A1-like [Capsicum annuum]